MKPSLALLPRFVLPALIAFAGAFFLMKSDLAQRIENTTIDWRTRERVKRRPTPPPKELRVVGIDEPSLKAFGHWPFNRAVHGDFLQLLSLTEPQPPTVMGWDILFPEPTPKDADFIEGLKISGIDVVLAAMTVPEAIGIKAGDPALQQSRLRALPNVEGDRSQTEAVYGVRLPAGALAQTANIGFADCPPESDGVRRLVPLVVRVGDVFYPTLSLEMMLRHWHAEPTQVRVILGKEITIETPARLWRIPIDAQGRYYINYRHGLREHSPVKQIGYADAYERLHKRYVEEKKNYEVPPLANRMVLLGQVADGLSDFGPTPFHAHTPLVMIHANVISNVLAQDYVRRVAELPIWLGGFLLGVISLAVFSERRLWEQVAVSIGLPLAYLTAATLLWIDGSWLLPMVGPVLGFGAVQAFMISWRVLTEQRAKEKIQSQFGTYLAPAIVKKLVASKAMPQLGGHMEEITAYFSDIQGYSTFSEKLPPDQLVELLNEYLTACTDTITEEGGTLDKYIGDAVVAMFGAPITIADHAHRACVSALRVQKQLAELRARWAAQGDRWPHEVRNMQSRIGLNTGKAIIGNMGSRTRFNYTMTGDNVNLAARMESGAKAWGAYTMCTEATKLACERYGGERVLFRPLARIVVKGRTAAVPIFEVVALKEDATAATRECLSVFETALQRYYARDWDGATAGFERSAQLEPNQPGKTPGVKDNPSLVYLRKAQEFRQNPPPPEWDGVHVMTDK